MKLFSFIPHSWRDTDNGLHITWYAHALHIAHTTVGIIVHGMSTTSQSSLIKSDLVSFRGFASQFYETEWCLNWWHRVIGNTFLILIGFAFCPFENKRKFMWTLPAFLFFVEYISLPIKIIYWKHMKLASNEIVRRNNKIDILEIWIEMRMAIVSVWLNEFWIL